MNRLIKLAKVLNSLGLNEESVKLIYFAKTAEVANHDEMNKLAPYSISDRELKEDFRISYSAINKMKELGISILSQIGRGAYGSVFSGIYNGKPVAVKVAIGPTGALNNDVKNWNTIESKLDSFPDFVKILFPKILLAYKDIGNDEREYQILVMEKLRSIPRELFNIFRGYDYSMLVDDFISKTYPDIKSSADALNLSFPSLRKFFEIVKNRKQGLDIRLFILDYLMSLIPTEEIEYEEDEPPEEDYNEVYAELIRKIEDFQEGVANIEAEPMPTFGGKHLGGNERLWEARGGLENFWKGISWLRDAGYSVSDLHTQNIMMDDAGNLKISDLGGFNFASDLGGANL